MPLNSLDTLQQAALHLGHWCQEPGQHWCLLGTTGSGKSRLARLLTEQTHCLWVGFESQQALFEAELYHDDSDFLDRIDHGRTGWQILAESGAQPEAITAMARRFGLSEFLARGYRQLSSGETRKLLIAQALLSRPQLLILDEPYDSLDAASIKELTCFLQEVVAEQRLLICVSRRQDVQPWHSHLALLHEGQLLAHGERQQLLSDPAVQALFHFDQASLPPLPPPPLPPPLQPPSHVDPLLSLHNSQVRYGSTLQFADLNWTLHPGEHTIIAGPNGAGKSTLLQLISGDHPQCYNNGITIFGYRRGSGESIWDVKRHLGLVSGALHQDYRVDGSSLSVLLSGLYDTIGLYQQVSAVEQELARQWLQLLGLADKAATPFRQLSWGEQRLLLIGRALIKQPALLLLDEPSLGLDDRNRFMVLACLQRLAELTSTTMLFVSHRQDEQLPIFRQQLLFEPADHALFQIRQQHL